MNLASIAQQLQNPTTPSKMHALATSGAPQAAVNTYDPRNPSTFVANQAPSSAYDMMGQSDGQVWTGDAGSGVDYLNSPDLSNANLGSLFTNAGYTPDPNLQDTVSTGDSGSGSDNATGAALQNWLSQNGYSLGVHSMENGSYTNLFDKSGNRVGGSKDIFTPPNTGDDAFGLALMAAAAFATGGAAGAFGGADAAGGAAAASDAGGGSIAAGADAAGTGGIPGSFAGASGGVGTGDITAAQQVADAAAANGSTAGSQLGTAFGGSGVDGAGGVGLSEGAYPAGLSGASSGGIAGTGITGTQAAGGASGLAGLGGSSGSAASNAASQYGDYGGSTGPGAAGQSLSTSPTTAGYTTGATTDPYTSGTGGGFMSGLQNALTTQNAAGDINGLSGLGKGLVGLGAGAIAGGITGTGLGSGDTSMLNSVNYQNAATAMGQSARTNQTNAQGSLTYNQNGVDAQGNPTYSQNVALNAPYQQNLNQALGNQSTAIGNLQNYNSGLSAAYANAPSLYGNAGSQADLVKQAQDAAYNSQTSYLDPQYAQQQKQLAAQLANQGVSYGSDAYNAAMTQFGSQQNQAYGTARDSAISQGDAYANTLFNQNLAANQQYNTNLNNQGTNYQNLSSNALTGVTQNPTFAATPAATNYLGAAQLQGNANLNQYNAKIGNTNNLTNGLTGIATAALGNQNVWNAIGSGVSGLTGFFGGGGTQ